LAKNCTEDKEGGNQKTTSLKQKLSKPQHPRRVNPEENLETGKNRKRKRKNENRAQAKKKKIKKR